MEWYRRYHGTCRDPKMEKVAKRSELPRPFAIAAWDAVLECASGDPDRGSAVTADAETIGLMIGCTEDEAQKLLDAFVSLGMIVDGRLKAWDKRNPGWDNAAERMKNYRERKRVTPATSPLRNGGVTVTARTEQNRTDKKGAADAGRDAPLEAPPIDEDRPPGTTTDALLDEKKLAFDLGLQLLGKQARSLIGKKLGECGIKGVMAALQAVEREKSPDPIPFFVKCCKERSPQSRPATGYASVIQ